MSTEIYANVREESKYFYGQRQEQPFSVLFVSDSDGYHWKGGIGGQYRTVDLEFFILDGDEYREVNLCNFGTIQQLAVTRNSFMKRASGDFDSSYWQRIIELSDELLKLAKRECKKQYIREASERMEEEGDY